MNKGQVTWLIYQLDTKNAAINNDLLETTFVYINNLFSSARVRSDISTSHIVKE